MKRYRFLKLFLVFALFSLLSIYFLVPGFLSKIILPYYPDTYIAAGILMHNMNTISAFDFSDLYHFPIYYPYSFTLTAGVNFFGQSFLLLPFYLIGLKNIYFLYNLMIVISLIIGGFSIYYLTKDFIQNECLSITAGAVYILHPIKQINYPHPAMLFFPLSILTVHFLLRYIRESRRTDALFFYTFLFLQAFFSLSLFFLTSLFCVILFLISLAIKRKLPLKTIVELSIGFILLAVFILVVFYPYISNPLDIRYQEHSLKRRVLIPSINFYSSWFPLTFKFLRGRPYPLHLGIMASFLIFFYFFSKAKTKAVKTANYILLVLLVLPFLLKFWRVIPLEYLYKALDVSMISLIAVFAVNTVFIWKKILIHEKVVLGLLIFVFLSYFGAIHRYIPFKYNFLNVISALLPQINRLRGVWRLQYYFVFLWILLAFLVAIILTMPARFQAPTWDRWALILAFFAGLSGSVLSANLMTGLLMLTFVEGFILWVSSRWGPLDQRSILRHCVSRLFVICMLVISGAFMMGEVAGFPGGSIKILADISFTASNLLLIGLPSLAIPAARRGHLDDDFAWLFQSSPAILGLTFLGRAFPSLATQSMNWILLVLIGNNRDVPIGIDEADYAQGIRAAQRYCDRLYQGSVIIQLGITLLNLVHLILILSKSICLGLAPEGILWPDKATVILTACL